jgi:hypothetical protein
LTQEKSIYLDKDSEVLEIATVPLIEWLEQLKAGRLGVNVDLNAGAVLRGCLVGVLAGIKSTSGQLVSEGRVLKIYFLSLQTFWPFLLDL